MECPNCLNEVELIKNNCDDIIIDQCNTCGGIWLDKGEFNSLKKLGRFYIDALDQSVETGTKSSTRNCPKCNNQMDKKMIKEVEIDICKECNGVWLDRGELKKLNQMV